MLLRRQKMIRKYLYIIGVLIGIGACKTEEVSVSDYIKWVGDKDNGLYKNTDMNDFKFGCMYKPVEWLSLREVKRSKLNISKFDSVRNELKGLQYFSLKIENNKVPELVSYQAEDNEAYQKNFNYYTGGMKNDIYLVVNEDTLPCILFHYERNYGASPINIFDLAFENSNTNVNADKQIIVYAEHMGMGIIKFKFNKEDINDIPKLKFN
jgi:hypothetical protein